MRQRQADIVEAIDEAVFPEFLDGERELFAVRATDDLVREVDFELEAGFGVRDELGDLGFGEDDGEGAVLVHVVVEAAFRNSISDLLGERESERTCRRRRKR